MTPVALMRLRKIKVLSDALAKHKPSDLIVQIKDDGFKVMAVKDKAGRVRLYSRRGKDITENVPKIETILHNKLEPGTTLLGELIYTIDNRQSLPAVSAIVQSKPSGALDQDVARGGDLRFHVYDVLEFEGKDITKERLSYRDSILRSILPARGDVKAVKSYAWSRRTQALKDAKKQNAEGLVIKPLDSTYLTRKRGASEPMGPWFKYKMPDKAQEADVLLVDYTRGSGKKRPKTIFSAYQYDDDGNLVNVGGLSGLPVAEEKKAMRWLDQGKTVMAEVSFQERHPKTQKLRHMGYIRLRSEKPTRSATINPLERDMEPVENPRTSKLKVALQQQALAYDDFKEFAEAYWNECARGLYWVPTDRANYELDLAADKAAKDGKFVVYCNPELALASRGNKGKEYVVELNLTAVPRSKIQIVRGSNGAKIKVRDLKNAFLVRAPLNAQKALRSWRYQQGLLPSSKEQLKSLYDRAHAESKEKAERELDRIAKRQKREVEREKRRQAARQRKRFVGNPGGQEITRVVPSHVNNPAF